MGPRAKLTHIIDRVTRASNWFKKIPQKHIKLNAFLTAPKGTSHHSLLLFPHKRRLECGTVGCVAGWMMASPAYKVYCHEQGIPLTHSINLNPFLGTDHLPQSLRTTIFSVRLKPDMTERQEALERLSNLLTVLKTARKKTYRRKVGV